MTANGIVSLWVDGTRLIFDLNKVDNATDTFIDQFMARVNTYDSDVLGIRVSAITAVAAAGAGIVACIPTAGGGCYAGVAVTVAAIVVMKAFDLDAAAQKEAGKKILKDISSIKRPGLLQMQSR